MDATQLTLFSGARPQASSKQTPPLGDETLGADQAFASMLQKSLTETERQRQLDLDRQNWRNQSSSYTASQSPQPQAQPSSTPSDYASRSQAAEKAPQGRHDRAQDTSSKPATAAEPTSPNKTSATTDQSSTKSSGKTDKSNGQATKDGDPSNGDQTASAAGNPVTGKQDAHHHGHTADGDNSSGNGQNQGQNPQDGKSQQSAADGTDGTTATVEGVEGTVLAGLLISQTPSPAGGAGSQSVATGGQHAAAGLVAGAQAAGTNGQAVPAASNANTTATSTAAGLAPGLSIPGPGTSPAASAPAQTGNNTAGNVLPQAAAALTTEAQAAATPTLDTTFANIIAKKAAPPAATSDNLHISMVKSNQDSAPQLPRPLVRIDDSQSSQPSPQPATTLTQQALTTASDDDNFDASLNQQDFGIDDLQAFNPLSTMLPGAGLTGLGKQVDMMTALRQQLATASLQDQVAIHMQRAAGNNVDKISIDLSPAELGRIHVKMSVDDDKQVSASITVERPATLDLLQRDTKALERALQDAGLKTDSGSLSFSLQRGNQGDSSDTPGWGQSGGRQIGSLGQEKAAATADVSSATAKNSVDTANGLVDVAV